MDKNSLAGILIIFAILIIFSLVNQPSEEEREAIRHRQDSIAKVEAEKAREQQEKEKDATRQTATGVEETTPPDSSIHAADNEMQEKIDQFGVFGKAAMGEQKFFTIENNLVKIT